MNKIFGSREHDVMNGPRVILGAVMLVFVLAACSSLQGPNENDVQAPSRGNAGEEPSPARLQDREYRIVTLLPRDAIPAIDNPEFLSTSEADSEYDPEEQIIGVSFNGQARAYSISLLSGHEIVNDEVGGVKIAVTW